MHAFFVHPADALHGPSAAVVPGDVLIVLSKAGKSAEINDFARVGAPWWKVISLTWKPDAELGALSDVVLVQPNAVDAEGEGVLPFGSTLAAGALCDALCLAAKTCAASTWPRSRRRTPPAQPPSWCGNRRHGDG